MAVFQSGGLSKQRVDGEAEENSLSDYRHRPSAEGWETVKKIKIKQNLRFT